ncbi:MAG: hypothetical protein FWE37_02405 [Spirochaetaceae bacterium]|nr:hypothetical protein [Spirochaetaceae bacterium]
MIKNVLCKYCGEEFINLRIMLRESCTRGKNYGHLHELYEGEIKEQYHCKYCGESFSSIRAMSHERCKAGHNTGKAHVPG